jgi:CHAT domain-containing protein
VGRALSSGWSVQHLADDAADSLHVTEALLGADLLHFAGHGRFDETSTWDSRLALTGTDYLSVADIVMLPEAPRFVVLSGCETGRTAAVRGALDMSLATAFVSAGTEAVVAVSRPVRDELAAAVAAALYASAEDNGWDPVESLPVALKAVAASRPEADWAAYRAWVR